MLVVDHLTRMSGERICVAVIDPATGHRYRPMLYTGMWTRADVEGLVEVGAVLEHSSAPNPRGSAPMVEDWIVGRADLRRSRRLTDDELWAVVNRWAKDSITDALPGVTRAGRTYRVDPHSGSASLGAVRAAGGEVVKTGSSVRLEIDDADGGRLSLPLTDLRFHRPDGKIESRRVQVLSTLLGGGEAMVISVGLAREFEGSHWLQANNVHFEQGFVEHAALNN